MNFYKISIILSIFFSLNIINCSEKQPNIQNKLAQLKAKITKMTPYLNTYEINKIDSVIDYVNKAIDQLLEEKIKAWEEYFNRYNSLVNQKNSCERSIKNLEANEQHAISRCCKEDEYACSSSLSHYRFQRNKIEDELQNYENINVIRNKQQYLQQLYLLRKSLKNVKFKEVE